MHVFDSHLHANSACKFSECACALYILLQYNTIQYYYNISSYVMALCMTFLSANFTNFFVICKGVGNTV